MEKAIKIKTLGKYNGHSTKPNKVVDLSFKFAYDEMVNYLQTLQMLNENVTIKVKVGDEQPRNLGSFMIKELKIDGDGEATLKVNSSVDFVDANQINEIVHGEVFKIMFEATIEVEEEKEEEDDTWEE